MKALSYENLLKLAINRGDGELAQEIKEDMEAERYWDNYFKTEVEKEPVILN